MIQFHIYPGGKRRIVTFSYDDGSSKDVRLIELFDRYGVKGTFHLNGVNYRGLDRAKLDEIAHRYEGHEIACHTLQHGWATRMPEPSLVREVVEDRRILEEIAGYPVVGMSYPSGARSDRTADVMSACGILYSRTTHSTNRFRLPNDFLQWDPTCHHKGALALCDSFLQNLDSQWTEPLFYIWGHSHEFKTEADWAEMEQILQALGENEKIWYATNLEICTYLSAQRMLRINYDETVFYNPTATDVWVEKDKQQVIWIPAGETVRL